MTKGFSAVQESAIRSQSRNFNTEVTIFSIPAGLAHMSGEKDAAILSRINTRGSGLALLPRWGRTAQLDCILSLFRALSWSRETTRRKPINSTSGLKIICFYWKSRCNAHDQTFDDGHSKLVVHRIRICATKNRTRSAVYNWVSTNFITPHSCSWIKATRIRHWRRICWPNGKARSCSNYL